MEILETLVLFAAVAAIYVLLCAGEYIAKWLTARFDWLADWFTEPDDADDDELVQWVRDLGDKP